VSEADFDDSCEAQMVGAGGVMQLLTRPPAGNFIEDESSCLSFLLFLASKLGPQKCDKYDSELFSYIAKATAVRIKKYYAAWGFSIRIKEWRRGAAFSAGAVNGRATPVAKVSSRVS